MRLNHYVSLQFGTLEERVNGKLVSKSQGWYWTRHAGNHVPIGDSNQTFARKYNAIRSLVDNNKDVVKENVFQLEETFDKTKKTFKVRRVPVQSVLIDRGLKSKSE